MKCPGVSPSIYDRYSQFMILANKCIFPATGNCSNPNLCHEGQCVTCDHSEEEEMLQLCTEQQQKDGFRCICKPGFELPYCEKLADPCANNLCENGAICQPTTKYNYEWEIFLYHNAVSDFFENTGTKIPPEENVRIWNENYKMSLRISIPFQLPMSPGNARNSLWGNCGYLCSFWYFSFWIWLIIC